jgi:oligoribonuclease NrnB/cAMP/cGMP phosphodiesterase (DHH superfamily)
MTIHILSHMDADGRFASFAAWRYFQLVPLNFIEVQYGQAFPLEIDKLTRDDQVYILDFSYDRATLDLVCSKVGKLQVIDHHETAKEELAGAYYAIFDMSKSGALLAWNYFFPDTSPPLPCLFVNDYDLHEWQYGAHTASFQAWLHLDKVGQDWVKWDKLCTDQDYLAECLLKGSVAVAVNEGVIDTFIKSRNNVTFNSFYSDEKLRKINYAIFNGMHYLRNEISSVLYKNNDVDMVIGWCVKGKEVIFSVRAPNPEKFSARSYAESHGGGGHAAAAAFSLPLDKGLELVKYLISRT